MNARQPYPPASSPLITRRGPVPGPKPTGGFQEFRGDRYYVITDAQSMRPFFTCLVSASDHFLFASSNGALTCGRRNAGQSLFTYTTEDKIRDSYATTGPYSALLIRAGEALELWEPFRESSERAYHIQRNLYKSARGDKLGFEELNFDLGLSFYYEWATSERFGFVRRSELRNLS